MSNYQGWLSFAFSLQVANSETSATVAQQITNAIMSDSSNTCIEQAYSSNGGELYICGTYINSDIIINQAAYVNAMQSCINKQILAIFSSNTVVGQMAQQTDEQSGIGEFIYWIIIAVIVSIVRARSGRDNLKYSARGTNTRLYR
jgi:hypothetical protein